MRLARLFTFVLLIFALCINFSGCDSEENDPVKSFLISNFGSQSVALLTGSIKIGTEVYTDYTISYFGASEYDIDFSVERNGYSPMSFKVKSKDGSYPISSSYAENKIQLYPGGQSNVTVVGSGSLSGLKIELLDKDRGKISFKITGNTTFTSTGLTSSTSYPVTFDFSVSFDNRTDPPKSTSGTGTSTGGTGTGGSGTSSGTTCLNTIKVISGKSYYSYFDTRLNLGNVNTATILKSSAGTNNANDISLVLNSSKNDVKFQVQLILPANSIANGTYQFNDDGRTSGVLEGPVGIFVVNTTGLTDSWRTNRDAGRTNPTGEIKITKTSSNGKTTLVGIYNMTGYGDGYNATTNPLKATVTGDFCITY